MGAAPEEMVALADRPRSINEVIVAALLLGAALLLIEVRFEHREVLGETWVALVGLVACLTPPRGDQR